jgi:peptidylprolyl isomerase
MYHGSIMKLTSSLLLLSALPAAAQTPAKVPVKPVHRTSAASACAKLPALSPKIPALPADLPCAKHLYTISIHPPVSLENVSPLVSTPALIETLHLQEATSFSLDYIDVKPGTGAPAAPHKWLTVNYTGYLVDGTKFDSSADHPGTPFSFQYGQIGGPGSAVPGWETGFDGMKVGAKRRLFVPQELGYRDRPSGKIPAKSLLIFDLELVAVSDTDPSPKPVAPKPPPSPVNLGPAKVVPMPATTAAPPTPGTPPPPATPKP